MFFRFSFRLPAAVLSDGVCVWLVCWAEEAGAGDEAPESRATLVPEVAPPVMPATPEERLGFPKRSTPSLAAEMMAEPSMEASKREGIEPVLPRPRPWETEPVLVVDVGACRAVRIGLLCCRLEA